MTEPVFTLKLPTKGPAGVFAYNNNFVVRQDKTLVEINSVNFDIIRQKQIHQFVEPAALWKGRLYEIQGLEVYVTDLKTFESKTYKIPKQFGKPLTGVGYLQEDQYVIMYFERSLTKFNLKTFTAEKM